jgi:hypothetical protein
MLPINSDILSSFPLIINKSIVAKEPLVIANFLPLNSQSMVPNLNVAMTEVNLLLAGISRRAPLPPGLLALSIWLTPLDKAAGRERIFAIAFLTLYPMGRADFNAA